MLQLWRGATNLLDRDYAQIELFYSFNFLLLISISRVTLPGIARTLDLKAMPGKLSTRLGPSIVAASTVERWDTSLPIVPNLRGTKHATTVVAMDTLRRTAPTQKLNKIILCSLFVSAGGQDSCRELTQAVSHHIIRFFQVIC